MGHKGLRATLPPDLTPYLYNNHGIIYVKELNNNIQMNLLLNMLIKDIYIKSMADIYKTLNIESYEQIPVQLSNEVKYKIFNYYQY